MSLWIKRKKNAQSNIECAIDAPDALGVDILAMNQCDFGFSTVGRRTSALCVGTIVKQSFDGQRMDVVNVASVDWYLVLFSFQAHRELHLFSFQLGSAIWLLLTKEMWAEAAVVIPWLEQGKAHVKLTSFSSSLLPPRPGKGAVNTWVSVRTESPSDLCWTCQVSRETCLCCSKPWDFWD